MKEKLLRNIAIACSILGLAFLFFISKHIEIRPTSISQLNYDEIGNNVKVCGEIASKRVSKNNHIFLKLKDSTGSIDTVIFNNTVEKIGFGFERNDTICVIGTMEEYNGRPEIIVKNIQVT